MAKPLPPSSPSVLLSLSRPSRRPRRTTRTSPAAPSAALLAVLAAVVGASTTTAAPAVVHNLTSDPGVPDFLCPALHASRPASASISQLPASSTAGATATATTSSAAVAATTLFYQDRETASAHPPQPHSGAEPWPCPRSASSSDFHTHDAERARVPPQRPPQSLFRFDWSNKPRNGAGRKIRRDADGDSDSDSDGDDYDDFYPLKTRTIPDRYELGVDGRWHKVSFWSSCPRCESGDIDNGASNSASSSTDTSVPADDLEASASISALATSSTYSPSATSTESPVYPDGWASGGSDTGVYKVAVIAVASVLLAAAITCAIATTLLWRRRSRAAHAAARRRDLERRRKKEKNDSDSEEGDGSDGEGRGYGYTRETGEGAGLRRDRNRSRRSLRDAEERDEGSAEEKTKAKWARAAARWKAHARWIHRRRRGRSSIVENLMQRDGANAASAAASGVSLAAASALPSKFSARAAPSLTSEIATGVVGQPETEVERVDAREEGRSSASYRRAPASDDQHNRHADPASGPDLGRTLSRHSELMDSTLRNADVHNDGENSNGARAPRHVEYDRPPPVGDLDDLGLPVPLTIPVPLDDEAQALGPPAYRSWRRPIGRGVRSIDNDHEGDNVENGARRARRDEKRAVGAAPVYVSAGGMGSQSRDDDVLGSDEDGWYDDYGPEDGGEDSGEGRRPVLHVATDDKHVLARLAASASAPPPPLFPASPTGVVDNVPLRPPPPPHLNNNPISPPLSTPSISAPPLARSTAPILTPNAPAWHDLEEAFEDFASDTYAAGGDSPGAGPGPSTATAWRASLVPRPYSPHTFKSPSSSHPLHDRGSHPVHSPLPYSPRNRLPQDVDSPFPPPPASVPSSALTYAPLPPGSESVDFSFFPPPSVGYEADEVIGEPSAPPFTPWPETEGAEDVVDVLLGASAPPLFDDEETHADAHAELGYSGLEYARPDFEAVANEEGFGDSDGDGRTTPESAPPSSTMPATVEQGTNGAAEASTYS